MSATSPRDRRIAYALALAFFLVTSGTADAHVKWFCGPIDGSIPPTPLRAMLSSLYLTCLIGFTALVGVGGALDAAIARLLPLPATDVGRRAVIADVIVRVGLSAYAVSLWANWATVLWADDSAGAVLTPEMLNRETAIGLLQLAIAVLVLIPRFSLLAAAGLFALYAIGVARFGLFYMLDYLFFIGLPTYVALGQPRLKGSRLAAWRAPILTASLSVSLMWTAVEKFLFPQWTIAVLLHHPGITAGFAFPTVATVAGFVEFSLSFYLLVGRAILVRVAAVLLSGVFIMAMPEFGMVDVVGHISVLVILATTLLQGETALQRWFRGPSTGLLMPGIGVAARYVATLVVLTALYYGLHAASIWANS